VGELEALYKKKDSHTAFDFAKMSRTLHPNDWDPQFPVYAGDMFKIFKDFKKDRPVNKIWTAPGINDEIAKVTKLYADHYKTGPLKTA
jgi:ribose transport system substrate-binding protein